MPLVTTIREKCRVCYTCVRECPAKAIRIAEGQAEVIPERCIGCGNCVRVCSQRAKQVLSSTELVRELLDGPSPVAAVVAPSFPAEFEDVDSPRLVGMLRAMGFSHVYEVGFGADLVADRYRKLLNSAPADRRYVATTCPAIVAYIERYHPDLIDSLVPVVSPMVAVARAIHRLAGPDVKVVFLGPCIAKKGEAATELVADEVDAVLTFVELREMFAARGIRAQDVADSEFDPPHAHYGALFSISRGLLQAADIREDLVTSNVVAAEGRTSFVEAIREFEQGTLEARLLEVLCCQGCIMGAGTTCDRPLFNRRSRVSQYVRRRQQAFDADAWKQAMAAMEDLDLSRRFEMNDQRIPVPFEEEIRHIMAGMGKHTPDDELNCGACGYDSCRDHAVAIFKGLAETEMCLPYTIDQLRLTIRQLAESHEKLADTQEALLQSEKLASMGQLAAGIAHEVNNPLGVVLMYAHLLRDECGDAAMKGDLDMIATQADRCKKIVSGLLHFARQNKLSLQSTDVRELVDGTLRVLQKPAAVTVRTDHHGDDPVAELDRDQIVQVLTNLVSNAFAAMPAGGTLTVRTDSNADYVRLAVRDTGTGIRPEHLNKIFEPFFTTKQIGKGTGLGLAVTYGIVKMHSGDIRVETNADPAVGATGTTFTVSLPRQAVRGSKPTRRRDAAE
ncbi:MAG TPA: histidine kinase [Phycisphaerales bacterium]|nr:histidine kinase [Phycisphaerales bacterium]